MRNFFLLPKPISPLRVTLAQIFSTLIPGRKTSAKTHPQPVLATYKPSSQRVRWRSIQLPQRVRQDNLLLTLSLHECQPKAGLSQVQRPGFYRFPHEILPRKVDPCAPSNLTEAVTPPRLRSDALHGSGWSQTHVIPPEGRFYPAPHRTTLQIEDISA